LFVTVRFTFPSCASHSCNQIKRFMCTLVGIPQMLAFFASHCPPVSNLEENDRQRHNQFPSMRVFSKLPRLFITIMGAMICFLANAEVTTTLPSNVLDDGGYDRRALATAGVYSFVYTGAVQTWYYSALLRSMHVLQHLCNHYKSIYCQSIYYHR
jgi:hypothetical protein